MNEIDIVGYVESSVPDKNHQWQAVMSPFGIMRTLMATDFIKFPAPKIIVRYEKRHTEDSGSSGRRW